MPSAHSWLPFCGSTDFSLGVEEELHMAAPMSLRPYAGTDAVLACLQPEVGSIAGEVSDGVLECITPVCERTGAGDRGPRPATRRGWRARRAAGDGCAPRWGVSAT